MPCYVILKQISSLWDPLTNFEFQNFMKRLLTFYCQVRIVSIAKIKPQRKSWNGKLGIMIWLLDPM